MTDPLIIHQFPCLSDNYGYLVHDPKSQMTAAVDTPDADAIQACLDEKGWKLDLILNTHHHADHTGGNETLKDKYQCRIYGGATDAKFIPGIDETVSEGDEIPFGGHPIRVLDVPGHTHGHVAYIFDEDKVAFTGDALFALGCGRVFEGSMEQMWQSLEKFLTLPDDIKVYCAHEYTEDNARFALTIEPQNQALQERCQEITKLRREGLATVPSHLGLEKATNPFLRPSAPDVRETLGMADASDLEVFEEIRIRKNSF